MKKSCAGVLVMSLAAFAGCDKGTSGGPGSSAAESSKHFYDLGQANDTFKLTPPHTSTGIKQGETKTVTIGITRGKNFDEDVTLKIGEMPMGVTLDPASSVLKHGDTEAKLTLKAADDAALGDFTIKITGHPTKGDNASNEFKITVDKK
jgi:uncharacterized membrane protein